MHKRTNSKIIDECISVITISKDFPSFLLFRSLGLPSANKEAGRTYSSMQRNLTQKPDCGILKLDIFRKTKEML